MKKSTYLKNIIRFDFNAFTKKVKLKGVDIYLVYRRNNRIPQDELVTDNAFYSLEEVLNFLKKEAKKNEELLYRAEKTK